MPEEFYAEGLCNCCGAVVDMYTAWTLENHRLMVANYLCDDCARTVFHGRRTKDAIYA